MPLMPVKLSFIEDSDDFIIKSEFCSGFRGSRLHFHSVLLLTADCVTLASLYQAACEASVFSLRMPFSNVYIIYIYIAYIHPTVMDNLDLCTGRHCWTTIPIEKQHSDQLQRKAKAK